MVTNRTMNVNNRSLLVFIKPAYRQAGTRRLIQRLDSLSLERLPSPLN